MTRVLVLALSLTAIAACTPYRAPRPPQPTVSTNPPPPITGTVVVQPQT